MSRCFGPKALVPFAFALASLVAQDLQPGAAAPALAFSQMVRGEPVKALAAGVVHLVDFWGDQAGLGFDRRADFARLQKQYGAKLNIVGVVGPDPDDGYDHQVVADYYAENGKKLTFPIGFDGDGKMHEAWVGAAGRETPAVFLVDAAGKVAWVGGMGLLEIVLPKVVAGGADPAKLVEETKAAEKGITRVVLAASLKPENAVAEFDKLVEQWPCLEMAVVMTVYTTLLEGDQPERGVAMQERVCKACLASGDEEALNGLAWSIVDPEVERGARNLDVAERAAKKAVALTEEKDPSILDTLARVWFWKKDYAQAVACQKKAVALVEDEEERSGLAATLAEYEKLAAQAAGK